MPTADPIVTVEDLRKVYRSRRRGDVKAVADVSLTVRPGEIVGLLGPNGAGKTTTIKCMCGLVRPTSGRIHIDGVDVVANPRRAALKVSAVLEGNRNIYWRLTPRENLEFFAALQGSPPRSVRTLIDDLLTSLGLAEKRDAESRTLSRGMQQKLALACALVKQTSVLLLDEPTLGLDVATSLELRQILRRMAADSGRTILLSGHDMDVIQDVCERVAIINDGRVIVADSVANLLDLFRVRAYRFTVSGPAQGLVDAIETRFPEARVTLDGSHLTIDVELVEGDRFYDLVDVLRSCRAVVETIDRRDPNLGEIFLRIVQGEGPR